MRPKSIRLFDNLFIAGVVLGLLNVVAGLTLLRRPDALPVTEQVAGGGISLIGVNIFAGVVAFILWYLVSKLRISFMRWVLAALVLLGVAGLPNVLALGLTPSAAILVIASALQVAGVWFLFRPDARPWFAAAPER